MYLLFEEVILVEDQSKREPEDGVVYLSESWKLYPVFPGYDEYGAKIAVGKRRYGTIYTDKTYHENWCVVPDVWSDEDANCSKDAIYKKENGYV